MIAFADPSLDIPSSLERAEDAFGAWLASPNRGVEITRPDGRVFEATAWERDGALRRHEVLSARGDTQVFALEELALLGSAESVW